MSVIVEWVRRSGVSSSKEVDFRSSCEAIPKEALIPNMRRIRASNIVRVSKIATFLIHFT